MFMGEFLHTVDDKGRIIIPAKFRDELGERFVMTKGLDKCLFVFPESEWLSVLEKLKTLPISQPKAREFVRFLSAGAAECEIDKQGRVLMPGNLKTYACLEKDAVVVGVISRVEIWSKSEWEPYSQRAEENSDVTAQSMADLGI
ncbi:MAG: division/cell wall cluster transcriptional repressor MraZ [Peptococcaceae bacterium]|nr:division/cell wall cluster transcriptional repressor MraZ [Peptococcaceae bacterium]